MVSNGRYLTIPRVHETDAGVYECVANNGRDADLRKLVSVQVRGKFSSLALSISLSAVGHSSGWAVSSVLG